MNIYSAGEISGKQVLMISLYLISFNHYPNIYILRTNLCVYLINLNNIDCKDNKCNESPFVKDIDYICVFHEQ